MNLVDVIGWLGAASLLAAYALVSTKKLEGNSIAYQLLNLAGGIFLVINSSYYGAYPSVAVNVVWIGIAIYAMTSVARRKSARN